MLEKLRKEIVSEAKKLQTKANKKYSENFTSDSERKFKDLLKKEQIKWNISYSELNELEELMILQFRNIKPNK